MRIKSLNIIWATIFFFFVAGCSLPNNEDPASTDKTTPESIFSNAEYSLFESIGNISVNRNITRLLAQYHSEVTYIDESRYEFQERQIPDSYSGVLYRDVLLNMEEAKRIIKATPLNPTDNPKQIKNKLAAIEICEVYAYQMLLDAFGNIPYSEALKGELNTRPKYDDAKTVYLDVINRLKAAIKDISVSDPGFGNADILYKGNMSNWEKFGNSLLLRMGMRLADVDPTLANALTTEALNGGVFTDLSQSAKLFMTGVSPYVGAYYDAYVLDGRTDFCPTELLINTMTQLNDPRRSHWFDQVDTSTTQGVVKLAYVGMPYGLTGASDYSSFSHFSEYMMSKTYPVVAMDAIEVEFLLAEAAERGLGGVTNAASHYHNAITLSMKDCEVSDAAAAAYLAQPSVAYATAKGNWKEKIGTQKWLGLMDRGVESWAEIRRLDYPVLIPPTDMTASDIPTRMPYPFNESKMNSENYKAAAAAIGGDKATTKLFWDKY